MDGVLGLHPWLTIDETTSALAIDSTDPTHAGDYLIEVYSHLDTVPETTSAPVILNVSL